MKNKYDKLIRKQNGISLIALTTTILVLAIVTSIVVYNAKNNVTVKKYKKLENDIEVLTNKIDMYYLKNNDLPVFMKSDQTKAIYDASLNEGSTNDQFKNFKHPNDNETYYIIDLNKIGGVVLNYGNEFFSLNPDCSNMPWLSDLYVINEQSHKIYYVKGVTVDDKTYYTVGNDTEISLYKTIIYIRDLGELTTFRDNVNNGQSYKGCVVMQVNDIDLEGSSSNTWIPIGKDEDGNTRPFEGEYNGGGHIVYNLYIDNTAKSQGFFGLNRGTIQNLGVTYAGENYNGSGKTKMTANRGSGVLVGTNDGGTILRCYNNIDATYNITNDEMTDQKLRYSSAELCGTSTGGRISKCYNTGNISANFSRRFSAVCGIVGRATNTIIEECYNSGEIVGTAQYELKPDSSSGDGYQDGNNRACGIADEIDINSAINNCYNSGNITLISKMDKDKTPVAAGIVGQNRGGNVKNCYDVGKITVDEVEKDYVTTREAAIAGCNYEYGKESNYINCYYLTGKATQAVGSNSYDGKNGYASITGNIISTESEMKNLFEKLGSAYKQGSTAINDGYPIFTWQ